MHNEQRTEQRSQTAASEVSLQATEAQQATINNKEKQLFLSHCLANRKTEHHNLKSAQCHSTEKKLNQNREPAAKCFNATEKKT